MTDQANVQEPQEQTDDEKRAHLMQSLKNLYAMSRLAPASLNDHNIAMNSMVQLEKFILSIFPLPEEDLSSTKRPPVRLAEEVPVEEANEPAGTEA